MYNNDNLVNFFSYRYANDELFKRISFQNSNLLFYILFCIIQCKFISLKFDIIMLSGHFHIALVINGMELKELCCFVETPVTPLHVCSIF